MVAPAAGVMAHVHCHVVPVGTVALVSDTLIAEHAVNNFEWHNRQQAVNKKVYRVQTSRVARNYYDYRLFAFRFRTLTPMFSHIHCQLLA